MNDVPEWLAGMTATREIVRRDGELWQVVTLTWPGCPWKAVLDWPLPPADMAPAGASGGRMALPGHAEHR